MTDTDGLRRELVARILDGDGYATRELRRAAFANAGAQEPVRTLIDKVARHAYTVTDDDVGASRAAGLSEDEIFELIVCAAVGQATRQYDAATAALDEASGL